MSDYLRSGDLIVQELKKFVEEESLRNKEWQEKHDREASTFRKEILEKIRPFEEFSNGLSVTWKLLLGVSAFVMSIVKAWAWVKEHLK